MSDLYERLRQIREQKAKSATKRSVSGSDSGGVSSDPSSEPSVDSSSGSSSDPSSGSSSDPSSGSSSEPSREPSRYAASMGSSAGASVNRLGSEWQEVAPRIFRRVTTHQLASSRLGDTFDGDGRWRTLSPLTRQPAGHTPVFLDIETSGLSAGAGSVAFLVGLGVPVVDREGNSAVEVTQLFLDELGYEDHLIDVFETTLSAVLDPQYVTYNGASFDIPVLRTRYILNRRRFPEHPHFDLLHLTRRLYTRAIGSCSLGAVEAAVLRKPRIDDVSGSEAPERYLSYLETRDSSLIAPVMLHHVRDIAHLAEVGLAVNAVLRGVAGDQLPADQYSLARILIERGEADEYARGIAILERLRDETGQRSAGDGWRLVRELLADEMRRSRNVSRHLEIAREVYLRLDRREDLVRVAKILEHDFREYQTAIELIKEWSDRHGSDEGLTHRLGRLLRKHERSL